MGMILNLVVVLVIKERDNPFMNNMILINKKRNISDHVMKLIFIVIFPLIVLLSVIQIYSFNQDFYMNQYEKNQVSKISKISLENLDDVTEVIIDYLKDNRKNLEFQTEIDGEIVEVFGKREKLHMEDVKELFQKGFVIRNYGIILIFICITIFFKFSASGKKLIFNSLLLSSILSFSIILILFIMIKMNFMKYFTHFHKIFFDNDLWLLDPRKDVLIQILPIEFFINISIKIGTLFTSIKVVIFSVSLLKLKQLNKYQS